MNTKTFNQIVIDAFYHSRDVVLTAEEASELLLVLETFEEENDRLLAELKESRNYADDLQERIEALEAEYSECDP